MDRRDQFNSLFLIGTMVYPCCQTFLLECFSYKDISALFIFTFKVIYLRNTYIYTETKKLIKKYDTRDPFEIIDQMNIVVGETSRYKTLKGYCFMSCKTIYVMISSFLSEEEKMIVAAHELGHIILHRSQLKMAPMQDDTLYNMTDNTEYQANLFAADLLIEDEDIEEMVQNEVRLIICRWRYRVISWRNNKGLKHSAIRKLSIYLTEVEYLC